MGMCSDPPPPPDLTESVAASKEIAAMQAKYQQDQLAWAKEQDTMNRGTLNRVLDVQMPIMQENWLNAQKDRKRYEETFQPLENNLVKEFQNYDSPERRAQERGRSIADVNQSFDATRRNALQRLESYGVDPSQTRNAALDLGTRVQQAAAQAGAAQASDRATQQTGRALRAEAINIGKGLPSNVAASYGQSLQAGNSGIGNANATTGASAGALTSGMGYGGTALQGYGQAANIQNSGYQNQMQAYNAQQAQMTGMLSAVGSVAGGAMAMADGGDPDEFIDSEPGKIDYGEGDGSGIDDQVPIMASKEEYIIPADVVRAKGVEFFDKLVERYHTPADEQREDQHTQNVRNGKAMNPKPQANGGLPRYAIGGAVGMAPQQTLPAAPMMRPQQPAPAGGGNLNATVMPMPSQPGGMTSFLPPQNRGGGGGNMQAGVMPGGQFLGAGTAPPQRALPAPPVGAGAPNPWTPVPGSGAGGGPAMQALPGGFQVPQAWGNVPPPSQGYQDRMNAARTRGGGMMGAAPQPQRPGMQQLIGRAVQQARPGMAPPRAQAQMPRRAIS